MGRLEGKVAIVAGAGAIAEGWGNGKATAVLFAGASAGGAGAIQNVDRVAATLRTHNACGADCSVEVTTIIDSIFGPRADALDWSTSVPCTQSGLCTYESVLAEARAMYPLSGDESCVAWHATNAPGTAYLCNDAGHVIRNHVTTPMMVRTVRSIRSGWPITSRPPNAVIQYAYPSTTTGSPAGRLSSRAPKNRPSAGRVSKKSK